jgi:hypothetical protein
MPRPFSRMGKCGDHGVTVKQLFLAAALLTSLGLMTGGCGSSSSGPQPSVPGGSTSMLAGGWSVTTTDAGQTDTIQATFVPNGTAPNWPDGLSTCLSLVGCVDLTACDLQWIYGDNPNISVQGPSCFTASTEAGLGSISDSNGAIDLILLVGAPENPVPDGSALNFALLENYQGSLWLFTGTGVVSGGNVAGSWSCSDEYMNVVTTPCPSGQDGTFSGSQE